MRALSIAALSALIAAAAILPATAQEDPNLPGVRITIQKRSYLDAGTTVPERSSADYAQSNLTGNTFNSIAYQGTPGFNNYPLPDTYSLPGRRPLIVDFQAPDFLMR